MASARTARLGAGEGTIVLLREGELQGHERLPSHADWQKGESACSSTLRRCLKEWVGPQVQSGSATCGGSPWIFCLVRRLSGSSPPAAGSGKNRFQPARARRRSGRELPALRGSGQTVGQLGGHVPDGSQPAHRARDPAARLAWTLPFPEPACANFSLTARMRARPRYAVHVSLKPPTAAPRMISDEFSLLAITGR